MKQNKQRDVLPTESIAALAYHVTRFGVLRTEDAARIGSYSYHSADAALNKMVRSIPMTKLERGVWAIADGPAEVIWDLRPLVAQARRDLDACPDRHPTPEQYERLVAALEMLTGLRDSA